MSLQRGTTYHLIHTQQFTGFGAKDRSMHCVPGSRRSGVRALPYSSIAWRLNSRARLWPISPVVLQRLSSWVWIMLVPRANKASARTASPLSYPDPPHSNMAVANAFLQVHLFLCTLALHAELAPQLVHPANTLAVLTLPTPTSMCQNVLTGGLCLLQRSHR